VSRELSRNSRAWDSRYEPIVAHMRAHEQGRRPKAGKFESSPWRTTLIQSRLDKRWSPEQIHLYLRRHHGDQPDRQACVETIYQSLYRPGEGGLSRSLTKHLRTGRSLRQPQRRPDRRTRRFVEAMRSIHDRPIHVANRDQPGHWEGDLITGAYNRSAIGTLVERTSRYTKLVHLDGDHTATTVTAALAESLNEIPEHLRLTLTWDQGSEMAEHHAVSLATGMTVYFCDPGSPWQRPSNENTNGLLRQYFPKGTDLSVHPPADLRRVETELNDQPRKSLNDRSPSEVFNEMKAHLDPNRCDDR